MGKELDNVLRLTRYSISVSLVLSRFRRGKYLEAIEDFEEVMRTSEDPKQKKDVGCVLSRMRTFSVVPRVQYSVT
jgi:hypothetical protein